MAVEINSESDTSCSWGIGYDPQELELRVEKEGIEVIVGVFQKAALLGAGRIHWKVFGEGIGV